VSDPLNDLQGCYLQLLRRACLSPVDGLVQQVKGSSGAWDRSAVDTYLMAHDRFLKSPRTKPCHITNCGMAWNGRHWMLSLRNLSDQKRSAEKRPMRPMVCVSTSAQYLWC
jgi:hypothetical protein